MYDVFTCIIVSQVLIRKIHKNIGFFFSIFAILDVKKEIFQHLPVIFCVMFQTAEAYLETSRTSMRCFAKIIQNF